MVRKGRQLKQMVKSGTTATFKYNSEGLRVQKTVNGTVTNYTLHGKNIVHMTQGSNTLHFWYDASNRPAIVQFNGTKYAYIHNLQGDIVGILNTSGTEVVKYTYDAWGKVLSTTGSLASTLGTIQPFRYRGYVYDVETECYYLRSRYYKPEWTLFLNADEISFCILQDDLLSYSPNKYCRNNPINASDENGEFWGAILAGALVGAICSIVTQVINGETINAEKVLVSAAAGALTAIPGIGFGATILITGSAQVANDAIDGKVNSIKDGAISFVHGAASGAVGYGMGKIISYTTPRNSFYADASNSTRKKILSQFTSLTGKERVQLKTAEGFASLVDAKGLGGALFGEKMYAGTCEFATDLSNAILDDEIEQWR